MIDRRALLTNVVIGSAATTITSSRAFAEEPIAETTAGKVRGAMDNGTYVFKGIPYGGDTAKTRFKAPTAPVAWSGVRDCLADGPIAPQVEKNRDYSKMSEDCLVLNLWTPALKDGRKRPVMVWLHGSGTTGGSSRGTYGANLARKSDMVVIAINHRVGVLGFLYLAEADKEFADSGNAGTLDIIRSLQWVKENIENFGGDPKNVTVAGCSGGGAKTNFILGMPAAKGLFQKAIIESGGSDLRTKSREEGLEAMNSYLKEVKLTTAQVRDLLKKPMPDIINGLRRSKEDLNEDQGIQRYFSPVIDGKSLPRDSFIPDASPVCEDVALIVGNGKYEYTSLLGGSDPTLFELTWDDVPVRLAKQWKEFKLPHDPTMVVAEYRKMFPTMSASDVFFLAVTDSKFWIGSLSQATRKSAQRAPVYNYVVTWNPPSKGGTLKSPHGIEVPLVFDSVKETPGQTGGGPEAQRMADQMSAAWAAFAHTGDPNTKAIPQWSKFDTKNYTTMYFDTPSKAANDADRDRRVFWQKLQRAVHA